MSPYPRFAIAFGCLALFCLTGNAQPPAAGKIDDRVRMLEAEVSALRKEMAQLRLLVAKKPAEEAKKEPMSEPELTATSGDADIVLANMQRSGSLVKLTLFATNQKEEVQFVVHEIETVDTDGVTRKTGYHFPPLKLRQGIKTRFDLILKDVPPTVRTFSAMEFRGRQGDTFLGGSRTLFTLKDVPIPGR